MTTDDTPDAHDVLDAPTDADDADNTPTETGDADVPRNDPLSGCPAIELASVVVDYEGGPNRRTVYPDDVSGVERMSTWLTADDAAFVDLESAR